jgi:hypothetical protein
VVEQRKALHERVHVGCDRRAEERELRVAVAARVVAEDLVVRAVLAHDVEDVLDRPAGAQRRPRRRGLGVRRTHIAVGDLRELRDALLRGEVADARGADVQQRQVLRLADRVVAVAALRRLRAVRIRAAAKPFAGDVDELRAAASLARAARSRARPARVKARGDRAHHRRVLRRRDPAGQRPRAGHALGGG